MPIHDWTRVDPGVFHDFHTAWIAEMRKSLNSGLLPADYYALAEQIAGELGPDVLTLQLPQGDVDTSGPVEGALTTTTAPPEVERIVRADAGDYTAKQRRLVIRHTSGHRIIALIEVVSPGNKNSRHAFQSFVNKAAAALARGIHLLILDLHPPTPRDPDGVHSALWGELTGNFEEGNPQRPLTLAAYTGGAVPTAYVQPVAVGERLPKMPVFLDLENYVNLPLESTYQAAYDPTPQYYKNLLEAPRE